ncbi:ABC transporter ATP-binding protein [Alkalibacterium gilvum]|uniref:ABC transporter ATP-binding protein n=1 Tax=Alkalibacterium gilvum TaxID=1130080 RepID=UPI003F8F5574
MKRKNNNFLLEVEALSIAFRMYNETFEQQYLPVIFDLNIQVRRGEILAIVGSSGSGKSLLAHAILGILPSNSTSTGKIYYEGDILTSKKQEKLRGTKIALVPQSVAYLDPLMAIGEQVRGEKGSAEAQQAAFKRYGLESKTEKMYPFQLSGGMARRVLVSTAVVSDADLIIADEPTPGLDLKNAMEALKNFREFADQGKGVILITHDIDLALNVADQVAVFYAGTTIEVANASDFRGNGEALRHPYTKALFQALPQNGFKPIEGFQPYPESLPKGCVFSPRCPHKNMICEKKVPIKEVRGGKVRCHNA